MKKKLILILLAVSLAFNLAVIGTFGHHFMMRNMFGRGPGEGPLHKHALGKMLGMSDAQVQLMEKDREEMRKLMQPMREELQKNREELFALVDADNVDTVKVDAIVNQISTLQGKIEKTLVSHSIKIRKNMTSEQRKKFTEFIRTSFKKMPPPDKEFPGDRKPF